jgi:uncharacterized cupredoxin-like copper-binding protein
MKSLRCFLLFFVLVGPGHAAITIKLGVLPGLRYDLSSFVVRPGEPVRIVFKNNDTMQHNLVITQPGKREEVVDLGIKLGAAGPDRHFVPDSPFVLHSTAVIAMDEKAILTFIAPDKEADYPFVCTFPGHGFLMHGVMHVSSTKKQEVVKNEIEMVDAGNGFGILTRPKIIRTWVPHASPAAIVVGLPGGQNYTWDAGAGHLRAAWSDGGFIDYQSQRAHVQSNGKPTVKWTQIPYYLEGQAFPFRWGSREPMFDFLGYRLLSDGHPQFRYRVNGVLFEELITITADGKGITRTFSVSAAPESLTFQRPAEFAERIDSDSGSWTENILTLSPEQAENFTLTIHE